MLLTTTPYVEGYVIKKYGPLVASEAVMGTNLFRDYFAAIRDVVGGRSGAFQTSLQEARMVTLKEIEDQAKKLAVMQLSAWILTTVRFLVKIEQC